MANTLYLVPSPIGNLNEISPRIKETLLSVDFIACEDTRNTQKLLSLIGISKACISCHEHNEQKESEIIVKKILNGQDCAYLSDAGFPCISDPGFLLVKECIKSNINIIPLSGPNAALLALIASGLDTDHFLFYGFLNPKISKKEAEIEKLSSFPYTIILYESPHRINETIISLYKVLGNRKLVIARELTKKFEEFIRSDLKTLSSSNQEYKGELVLVLEGYKEIEKGNVSLDKSVLEKAKKLESLNYSKKEIASILSTLYELNKNQIYKELIKEN